jgi:peptidoglycan/xylan/chitin deacetylase (PgdA/CDA1 family)
VIARWVLVVAFCAAGPAHAEKTDQAKPAKAKSKSVDQELLELTNDPLLGKADQIEGSHVKGMVTFTFDDGPDPDTTPAVMNACAVYDVPAAFFIVTRRIAGKLGERGREILKKQLEQGFVVASHSVSHPNLRGASPKKLAAEIDQSIRTLAKEAERPIGMFRAPFGAIDKNGRAWLKKRGLTEAFWSIDTLDWQAKNPDKLRKKVMKMILAQDGGVVLMHDVKPITAQVIGGILDDLEAENCKRLAENGKVIWPVSIHYFLRDKKQRRSVPDDVEAQTAAYKSAFPTRCFVRSLM